MKKLFRARCDQMHFRDRCDQMYFRDWCDQMYFRIHLVTQSGIVGLLKLSSRLLLMIVTLVQILRLLITL